MAEAPPRPGSVAPAGEGGTGLAGSPRDVPGESVAPGTAEEQAGAGSETAAPGQTGGAGVADQEMVFEALREVYDPEIGLDIVSLGLVYGAHVDGDGELTIDMTLTSPYCPLGGVIETQAAAVCQPLPGVATVRVNFVWSPPWDPRTMASDEAKLELGIY